LKINKKLEQKEIAGITLIALVITIIVLLILAGISVMMLTGENSILKQAGKAKDSTEISQEIENIKLAYNSAVIDKIGQSYASNITTQEFERTIKAYYPDALISSEGSKIIVTFSNGHKYTIYKNGKVNKYTEPPYAKDILTVAVSGNSVTSPYYVNYPSAKGTIKCRVLYNDSTYGLQIVSVNPVTKVTLGKNDSNPNVLGEMETIERAQNSYMRAITTLNEKAEEYLATNDGRILATEARCVGSKPQDKNYPDNTTGETRKEILYTANSSYTFMEKFNGKFFKSDTNYNTDIDRLEGIGAYKFEDITNGSSYFLASRFVLKPSSMRDYFSFMMY